MEKFIELLKNIFLTKKGIFIFIFCIILETFTNLTRGYLMNYSKFTNYINSGDMFKLGVISVNKGLLFSILFNWIIFQISSQLVKLISYCFSNKINLNNSIDISQLVIGNTMEMI